VIEGHHPRDPSSLPDSHERYRDAVNRSIEGISIAYTPDYGTFPVETEVRETVGDAVETFRHTGATVEKVDVQIGYSHTELTDAWLNLVGANLAAMNEWLAQHEDLDLLRDYREEMTDSLVNLIESGKGMTATEYLHHHVIRTAVHDAIEDIFEEYDLLVSPTVCHPPVENAAEGSTLGPDQIEGESVDHRIGWCPTYLFNFTGHPAASVPAGTVSGGLPVGMQIVGPRFEDDAVIAASGAFERVRPWSNQYHHQ
jgi:amidase/aspartyl-tRNA(Asn)/glutamyl-tRNA(Gln) amidotransferase subunit A